MPIASPQLLAESDLPQPLSACPNDPPVHHVRAALGLRLRALLRHDPGTRSGEDIEDLHQMRVAVRRMRATLTAALPLLDASWARSLRSELGWLGRGLGPVRDLDVMLERLRGEIAGLPEEERRAGEALIGVLEREHAAARAAMLDVLDSARYAGLLERLADAIRLPLPTRSATAKSPRLIELPERELRKLRRDVRKAGDDPADEVLHALRIRAKRVRYTGELVAPALAPARSKQVKKLVSAATALQDVLGAHQDACVAEQRIRELLDGLVGNGSGPVDAHVVFVAGRLVEREHERATDHRREWRGAWDALTVQARTL